MAGKALIMQAIAITHAENQPSNNELRLGILSFNAAHEPTAFFGSQPVHFDRALGDPSGLYHTHIPHVIPSQVS